MVCFVGMATALKVLFSNEACQQKNAAKRADGQNGSSKSLRSDDDSMSSSSTPTGENGGDNGSNSFNQKHSRDSNDHSDAAQKHSSANGHKSNAHNSNGSSTNDSHIKGDSTNGNSAEHGKSANGTSNASENGEDTDNNGCPPLVLERNEVIALIVMLRQFSVSIEAMRQMSAQLVGCEDSPPERDCYGCIEQLAHTKFERVLEDF